MNSSRILIIDDEIRAGRGVQQSLVRLGYIEPEIAENESDALEILQRADPDLVIMDIQTDGRIDAMSLAKKVRYDYGKLVIFLTAATDETH